MIGIYNQVWMAPYNMEQITQIQIKRDMKDHDVARIKGSMSITSMTAYQNMIDGKTVVSIYFKENEQIQLLFAGFVKQLQAVEIGNQREVWIEMDGLTQALDRKEVMLDYQDVSKKNTDIIEAVMKSYSDISYEVACKQEQIEAFVLQYEETDYEFLQRVVSRVEAPIYTTMQGQKGRLNYGVSVRNTDIVLDGAEWEAYYNKGWMYRVETEEYLDLGMEVTLDGKKLIVIEVNHLYQNGESQNVYLLGMKEICKTQKKYNNKIIGISLDGVIKACSRDQVKIELNKTLPCEEEKRKWFAYSSPAASTDGSGWYCMPQIGEEIRLFCPTQEESEAYVVSAIRKSGKEKTKPNNKVLANTNGQAVSFLNSGIDLSCKDGVTTMTINQDGTIEIIANQDIHMYAQEMVMLRAEQGMCITAGKEVILQNDTGSKLVIGDEIIEDANRIKNNC